MTIKNIFVLDALATVLFGVAFIAFPQQSITLFNINPDAAHTLLAQLLGGALIGIGMSEWFARNATRAGSLPIVKGVLCYDVLAVIVSVQATIAGTVNFLGWMVAGIFLFFGIARIFALLQEPVRDKDSEKV